MEFPWNKYDELPTGRRNTLQIFIITCPRCTTQLEVFKEDVCEDDVGIYSYSYYCNCVHCKKLISLDGKIPNNWKG